MQVTANAPDLFSSNRFVEACCGVLCHVLSSSHELLLNRSNNCAFVLLSCVLCSLAVPILSTITYGYGTGWNVRYVAMWGWNVLTPMSLLFLRRKVQPSKWLVALKLFEASFGLATIMVAAFSDLPYVPFQNKAIWFLFLFACVRSSLRSACISTNRIK